MNTVTAPPFPSPGIDPALPPAACEQLLAQAATHAPSLVAIFDAATGCVLYLNEYGRRWLTADPTRGLHAFTLSEIIGVRSLDQFNNIALPHAQVLGVWRGQCDLRDVWGSETSAEVRLLKQTIEGAAYFCVVATKLPTTCANHAAYDRELLQALLANVRDQVYFKDRNSRFLRVSRSIAEQDGYADPAALIG
ncbi:MAG TPA: hypothetical protein VK477_05405, partial [Acidobacteriota bacterium]|nr:hypothetical protein [Acidobacteriota bacterium]